uniref:Immunoglobulin domain-containing protein n=1 Tax=Poecilia mexicana TaxID=48701 RepID=A0A3B3WBC8_9TELE
MHHLMLPTLSFAVPFLCLLLLMKDKVDSVDLLAPEEVTASPGGLVKVACQYDLQFKERPKYWCKGSVYEFCRVLVKTTSRTQHDRYFIADDRAAGVFTVTMTSLVESDEDKYWCVISRYGRNIFKGVRLVITQTVVNVIILSASSSLEEINFLISPLQKINTFRKNNFSVVCCSIHTHLLPEDTNIFCYQNYSINSRN